MQSVSASNSSVQSDLRLQSGAVPWQGMRVLLDARKLQHGGIGTYIENLLFGLLKQAESSEVELSIIVNKETAVPPGLDAQVEIIRDKARPYSINELFTLGRRLDFSKFDVFHTPHFVLPYALKIPSVVTVHDLIHLTHPEQFFYPTISRQIIRSSLKRANQVLTVSAASATLISSRFKAVNSKLSVVPNTLSGRIRPNYGLADKSPYIMAVFSNQKAHKGLNDLLSAWKGVVSQGQHAQAKLLLVGQGFENSRPNLVSIPRVELRGQVSELELAQLYTSAQALVVPSLVEGFCIPALEAHACGTAVVMRPELALRELAGDEDFLTDDWSIASLERSMINVLQEPKRIWSAAAEVRARYRPEIVARRVLEVYCKACSL